MGLLKLKDFINEQEKPAEKAKKLQDKTNVEKAIIEIDKRIADADLAFTNLEKRVKDGTLKKSEALTQQAIELQKKVAEYQKKSVEVKKLEALES